MNESITSNEFFNKLPKEVQGHQNGYHMGKLFSAQMAQ